jgi:hypothetical protein
LIFGTSCSKTQDTAPETRLFGSPPVINNVTLSQSGSVGEAACQYGQIVEGWFCGEGYALAATPDINIQVNYSELQFTVQATDPDTQAGGQNDILLVAASYQRTNQGQPVETSLVMLDDGSLQAEPFQYSQQGDIFEACVADTNSLCGPNGLTCSAAKYTLTSNDAVTGDSTFSRGFALISNMMTLTEPDPDTTSLGGRGTGAAVDCVAAVKKQFPAITDVPLGQPVSFKIEVVDRAGNLTAWPTRPQGNFQKTTIACTGDACGCCFLVSDNPVADCRGRPGLEGAPGSGFEAGFCTIL